MTVRDDLADAIDAQAAAAGVRRESARGPHRGDDARAPAADASVADASAGNAPASGAFMRHASSPPGSAPNAHAQPRRRPAPPPRFSLLRTRDGHRIAYAVVGAAGGAPVVALHGGPASGSQPSTARLFDLARARVVLIDQRGAGASRPHGSVRRNDTNRLIEDIETVRRHLGIACWGVLGGSWGASLALAYAGRHPQAVTGVVLRGLFLTSAREVDGLFVASRRRAPREWRRLWKAAGCRADTRPAALLGRCHAALQRGANGAAQRAVALAWRDYENAVLAYARPGRARREPAPISRRRADALARKYRVQAHYLRHRCWLGEPALISLARRAAAAGVPLAALHGRRDPVCPPDNLRRFARAVPSARVEYVANAGHLATDPPLRARVMRTLGTMFVTESSK